MGFVGHPRRPALDGLDAATHPADSWVRFVQPGPAYLEVLAREVAGRHIPG